MNPQTDGGPVAPETKPKRLSITFLAMALDRPKRWGAVGFGVGTVGPLANVFAASFLDMEVHALAIAGPPAVAGAGLWLLVAPVPQAAKERILGQPVAGEPGVWWTLWQLGLGLCVLGGAGVGVYLFLWFTGMI